MRSIMRLRSERSGTKTAASRHSTRASGGRVGQPDPDAESALPRSEPAGVCSPCKRLIIQRDAPALRDPEALSPGQVHKRPSVEQAEPAGPCPIWTSFRNPSASTTYPR